MEGDDFHEHEGRGVVLLALANLEEAAEGVAEAARHAEHHAQQRAFGLPSLPGLLTRSYAQVEDEEPGREYKNVHKRRPLDRLVLAGTQQPDHQRDAHDRQTLRRLDHRQQQVVDPLHRRVVQRQAHEVEQTRVYHVFVQQQVALGLRPPQNYPMSDGKTDHRLHEDRQVDERVFAEVRAVLLLRAGERRATSLPGRRPSR